MLEALRLDHVGCGVIGSHQLPNLARSVRKKKSSQTLPVVERRLGIVGAKSGIATDLRPANSLKALEAPPGFEPGMEVLQTSALPLGDGALN